MVKFSGKKNNYPKHIAVILDGNRRWAKKNKLSFWKGIEEGYKNANRFMDWTIKFNIKEITLYCFSLQNFKRPKIEVILLMKFFERAFLKTLKDLRVNKYKVQIRFCGRIYLLPEKVQYAIKNLEEVTKKYKDRIVNFCLAYGGQEEIVDAVNKICNSNKRQATSDKAITKEMIEENLQIKSLPDIIIRTSGEQRTSNFLCWQQAYSEWFFVKKFWPDFTKADLKKIINQYLGRERRFGK